MRFRLTALPLRWRLWLLYVLLLVATLGGLGVLLDRRIDELLVTAAADDAVVQLATLVRREVAGISLGQALPLAAGLGHPGRSAEPLIGPPDPAGRPPGTVLPPPPPGAGSAITALPVFTPAELHRVARRAIDALNGPGAHLTFFGRMGELVLAGAVDPNGPGVPAVSPEDVAAALRGETRRRVAGDRQPRVSLIVLPIRDVNRQEVAGGVALAVSLAAADATTGAMRWVLGGGALVAMAVGALLGLPATRALLQPLERVVAAADRARGGDLSARARLDGRADEVGRLGAAFDQMLGQIQSSFETQRQFLADASHELRSPLGGLSGMLEVLANLDPNDAPARERALRAMAREVERVNRLVADLLLLSRIESRALEREPVDLAALVEEELETRAILDPRPVHVVTAARPMVAADRHSLARLIRNVLDNAARATEGGGDVSVHVAQQDGVVSLAVRDTGAGITPEALPHIFDRFYRADEARSRRTGGTGLGLAIVQAIAVAHGGTVRLDSAGAGRGATFTLELPVSAPRSR